MNSILHDKSAIYAEKWIGQLDTSAPVSSNMGASGLPFQRWFHFKEAYSPEFVKQSIEECPYTVSRVLDPFGGSGTTALTCRILGINSISIEVNPFLSELIRAKTTPTSSSKFSVLCSRLIDETKVKPEDQIPPEGAPKTLVEPGLDGRFVFGAEAFGALRALARGARAEPSPEGRLALITVGSIIVECSNVLINGKGRRYRQNWKDRRIDVDDVFQRFEKAANQTGNDLLEFSCYLKSKHKVYNNDARKQLRRLRAADLVVFSPPYPNSFDYTDVYNLELWMLGYFGSRTDNRTLRHQTLRSHVQIKWPHNTNAPDSHTLSITTRSLREVRDSLWNRNIPEMIEGYFADLSEIFYSLSKILPTGGRVRIAVGDSQYAGILIDVPKILSEITPQLGFEIIDASPIRSMRSSAQHGGRLELVESAITFRRN